jgi:hypothetical protein
VRRTSFLVEKRAFFCIPVYELRLDGGQEGMRVNSHINLSTTDRWKHLLLALSSQKNCLTNFTSIHRVGQPLGCFAVEIAHGKDLKRIYVNQTCVQKAIVYLWYFQCLPPRKKIPRPLRACCLPLELRKCIPDSTIGTSDAFPNA